MTADLPPTPPNGEPRDWIRWALEVLAVGLGPFLANLRGPDWPGPEGALTDPRFLLRDMIGEWDALSPPLSRRERSFIFELKDTGNRLAHFESFSSDDADRTLDTVDRLLSAIGASEETTVRQARGERRLRRESENTSEDPRRAAPPRRDPPPDRLPQSPHNWQLILAAACALTAAGETQFTRIGVYEWIWARYLRSEHDRPALDPTFQGMVRNATGGPPSAGGTPLLRVERGLFVLDDSTGCDGVSAIVNPRSSSAPRPVAAATVATTVHAQRITNETAFPGHRISSSELAGVGFAPLELRVLNLDIELPSGLACEWATMGEVPAGPGLYAFTVEDDYEMRVTYVGLTEHLWMVTRGQLPDGSARGGQRYGRPRHAGATRQRINILIAEQLRIGREVRHWVRPLHATALRVEEERLITVWSLRRVGWNRG